VVFSQDDISIDVSHETNILSTSAHGQVDERSSDSIVEATFTPEGRWTSASRALLWPYGNAVPGDSIMGADTPTLFHGSDGGLHTIPASAVTSMPSIFLSASRTMIGPVTIRGVRKTGVEWSGAESLYATSPTGSTFADATFAEAELIIQKYTGAWAAIGGFDAIETVDGWTIDFDLQIDPIVTDDLGTVDFRYRSLAVSARCTPVDPLPAEILVAQQIQGTGAARGRSLAAGPGAVASDLIITGANGTTVITLKNAALKGVGFRFGASVLREGEIAFVAGRPFTTGVKGAIFTLA